MEHRERYKYRCLENISETLQERDKKVNAYKVLHDGDIEQEAEGGMR